MFSQYKTAIGVAIMALGVASYFYYQEVKIENLKSELVIKEEEKKIETFEIKWETIANERNKTKEIEDAQKEPITHNIDSNTTTIYFFGLF